jgi:signal transduction histidine kinase
MPTRADPPAPRQVLHESDRTRITRVFLPGHTVICKEPLGPLAERRLRHESTMLERVRGVVGVAELADVPQLTGSIVLQDGEGRSLRELAKPVTVDELIGLGVALARGLAGMHGRGVIHRDISPANIVISPDGAPCLVDFASATSLAEIRPEFTHHSSIVGALSYVAPEQTGRTGRSVDQRADLYAFGATLYELATGEPPFISDDPMRLIHDHLARVPTPVHELNPDLPASLSEVVMHLLEKEPDNRYQTADSVVYDLERVGAVRAGSGPVDVRVGGQDVPLRVRSPARLVGRDAEVAALAAAFEDARAGRCRGVLVSGAPGVGKTALVHQLRPVVTATDGWFVAGKFDQYRRDLEVDAGYQAFRALGRLLLAEPEDELANLRNRILRAVGPNAGLLSSVLPEFAALLAVPPDPGDPMTAQVRVARATAAVLQAVASSTRPVVLFLDDLQWAGRTPLGFIDVVLSEAPIEGLLIVGAYREGDVHQAHLLATQLFRWRDQTGVQDLRLDNLPVPSLVAMVAELLHVEATSAAGLVAVIQPYTSGNPYETVELLSALRRDRMLTAIGTGWRWDERAVRAHLGQAEVAELLAAQVASMPPPTRRLLEAMACLGGRADLLLLQTATGEPARIVDHALAPALDEDLLVVESGVREAVLFRHDRIREAVLGGLDPRRRRSLRLSLARRLAAVPQFSAVAAEQYLPVVDAVEPGERAQAVRILRRAAGEAGLIGNHARVDAMLAAALRLIDPADIGVLVAVHTDRHAALYGLGRLEEADEEFRAVQALSPAAIQGAASAEVQVISLTHRKRFAEAVALGQESMRELGMSVPTPERLELEVEHGWTRVHQWLDDTDPEQDLALPELTDPRLLAAGQLIAAVVPAAYLEANPTLVSWLHLEALRISVEHGPGSTLLGPATAAVVPLGGDYAVAYRAARRIVAMGEGRGLEPGTSAARHLFSIWCCWAEPIENAVRQARQARETMLASGDTMAGYTGYSYQTTVSALLDCAPSLEAWAAEVDAGLAFAQRTDGDHIGQSLDRYRWLADVLLSKSPAAGEVPVEMYAGNPLALLVAYLTRATAAAIFGDTAGLQRHSAAAMPLMPAFANLYPAALTHLLRGLALGEEVRHSDDHEQSGLLAEMDQLTGWLAARAGDAPANFLHLLRLLEAERAWAVGDFRAAVLAFDAARRAAAARQRPWHRALIAERAARFYLEHGVEHAGHVLLAEARREYLAWGATAKVDQLDWAYPTLRSQPGAAVSDGVGRSGDVAGSRAAVSTGTMDLLAILSASQALSSETSVERLHARIVDVLSAMTGATGVDLLLWRDERPNWLALAPEGAGRAPIRGTDNELAIPMSVLRYVERVREPLVVDDAARDERFARDPYFGLVDCCSLLAVPILSRGQLRAVLMLENRLIRGAFTIERLDAVKLIAGQLAVSLDNSQLYADFRRIAEEQAALRRVATLVAQGAAPAAVFDAVAEEVKQLLAADNVDLIRFEVDAEITIVAQRGLQAPRGPAGSRITDEGESLTARVRRTGRPARSENDEIAEGELAELVGTSGTRVAVGAPIVVEGALWGLIAASWSGEQSPPFDTEDRMAQFAQMIATAIANADSRDQLTASRARLVTEADEARRRVVRDLHDGAQQRLVHTIITLQLAQRALRADDGKAESLIGQALEHARQGQAELRDLSHGILPSVLTDGGLHAAIHSLVAGLDLPADVDIPRRRFPAEIEASAYFIVAEALTNVVKHSYATCSEVRATVRGETLHVMVRDDGTGGADAGGHGLVGMNDRITALGGSFELDSRAGGGTAIMASLPLRTMS